MTEIAELQEQIKVVAQARLIAKQAFGAKVAAHVQWENDNQNLLADVADTAKIVEEAEAKLRELTLAVYAETGNKKPAEGVGIREITKLDYDPKEALKWAMAHQIALSLDKKSFEGFAKATPLEFVTVSVEAQATIATDLSAVIAEK